MNTETDIRALHERDPAAVALGTRLEEARGTHPRRRFAMSLGVHENTLGKWERGETVPSALQVKEIAAMTGYSVTALLGLGEVGGPAVDPGSRGSYERDGVLYVPVFDLSPSASYDDFDSLSRIKYRHSFSLDFIRRDLGISHDRLYVITAPGGSAEPDIHQGDLVLIDLEDTSVMVEGLHLVRIAGGLMLKILQRRPGAILVSSPSKSYGSFEVTFKEGGIPVETDFDVIGRCRWAGVTLR